MTHFLSLLRQSTIVALGGFLLGFDISVIAGVVGPIRDVFSLSDFALGWSAASPLAPHSSLRRFISENPRLRPIAGCLCRSIS